MSKRVQIFSTGPELTIGVIVECATGPPILVCAQLVGDTEEALRGKVNLYTRVLLTVSIHLETTVGKPFGDGYLYVCSPEVMLEEDIPPVGVETG